jgi:hypothetical protein
MPLLLGRTASARCRTNTFRRQRGAYGSFLNSIARARSAKAVDHRRDPLQLAPGAQALPVTCRRRRAHPAAAWAYAGNLAATAFRLRHAKPWEER